MFKGAGTRAPSDGEERGQRPAEGRIEYLLAGIEGACRLANSERRSASRLRRVTSSPRGGDPRATKSLGMIACPSRNSVLAELGAPDAAVRHACSETATGV